MVDVAFDFDAATLPGDFEWPLYRALVRIAPWLESAHFAGIHPLRATRAADGSYLVARRTKLVLRMPRDRLCAASALEGAALDLGLDVSVRVGAGTLRGLEPAPTLHSSRVVTGDSDEASFSAHVMEELGTLGIHRPIVCGRRSTVRLDGDDATAFSVAVHGLGESASLLLQRAGLGRGRAIGCGLFVPHKTIATPE
jgi:CRISPR-associated protein Cas6